MRPCRGCGAALQNNVVTCPDCGVSLDRPAPPPRPLNSPTPEKTGNETWVLWFDYLLFPVLFAIFAGVISAVHWGWLGGLLAIPVGIIALMIRVGADLI